VVREGELGADFSSIVSPRALSFCFILATRVGQHHASCPQAGSPATRIHIYQISQLMSAALLAMLFLKRLGFVRQRHALTLTNKQQRRKLEVANLEISFIPLKLCSTVCPVWVKLEPAHFMPQLSRSILEPSFPSHCKYTSTPAAKLRRLD
jgi:hypothetical protein